MKLKAILVDDETAVRYAVRELADWDAIGIELVGEASNGLEALQMAMHTQVDILLTDIRMPGMDGIALMEALQKIRPDIRFVVISAHEDFSYLKAAMKLKVIDYILKPVDRRQLNEALTNSVHEAVDGRNAKHLARLHKQETRKILEYEKDSIMQKLAGGVTLSQEDRRQLTSLTSKEGEMDFHAIIFRPLNADRVISEAFDADETLMFLFIRRLIEETFEETGALTFRCLSCSEEIGAIAMAFEKSWTDSDKWLHRRLLEIQQMLYQHTGLQTLFGHGYAVASVDGFRDSFLGARSMMLTTKQSFRKIHSVVNTTDLPLKNSTDSFACNVKDLLVILESGREDALKRFVEQTLAFLQRRREIDMDTIYCLFHAIESWITTWRNEPCNIPFPIIDVTSARERFVNSLMQLPAEFAQAETILVAIGEPIARFFMESARVKGKALLENVHAYIDQHYHEPLGLTELADRFHISSGYLGRAFKEVYQVNVIDYLNEKRLEKAKWLISVNGLSVSAAMEAVGFNHLNYFGKQYKRRFGVAPSSQKRHDGYLS